jgi:hypothetical protein
VRYGTSAAGRRAFFNSRLRLDTPAAQAVAEGLRQQRGPVHLEAYDVLPPETYRRFRRVVRKTEEEYLRQCGMHFSPWGSYQPEYTILVKQHGASVKPFVSPLIAAGAAAGLTWGHLTYSIMSFVHQLPYKAPAMFEGDRMIAGLWPPLVALYRGMGDCDTKAVLFSALVSHLEPIHATVVVIPAHAFNGLVGWHKRFPGDFVLQHRGVDMLLVDLTGFRTIQEYARGGTIHEPDKQNLRERLPIVYETK